MDSTDSITEARPDIVLDKSEIQIRDFLKNAESLFDKQVNTINDEPTTKQYIIEGIVSQGTPVFHFPKSHWS